MEKTKQSVSLFTNGIIDYAGLFPPAKLDLSTSFNNFRDYLAGEYADILSRFICPAKLLPELRKLINNIQEDIPDIYLSIILTASDTFENFKINLNSDMELLKDFRNELSAKVNTDCFEYRIPEDIISSHDKDRIIDFLKYTSDNSVADPGLKSGFYCECILGEDWKKNIAGMTDAIEIHNEEYSDTGFKLRTGGVTAEAIPSSEQITYAIRHCLNRNLEMKFTAGLHHPFRHFDEGIGTKMHGFVNVFSAGIISKRHNISDIEMEKLLEDESPDNFKFTENGFTWKGFELENKDIHFARTTFVRSFGSCSFDEPLDDLKKLKLII